MNGCIYRTNDGECDLWTDGKHKSFCDTDCIDKHPSNADKIRSMTDEDLATWLVYNAFKNIDGFLNDMREQANISVTYPKDEKRLFENTLKWLREEVSE